MCTLLRHGAVIPSNVRKKQKRVHAEHGLLTSCHRFIIEFEARWGTRRHPPRACVIPIWLKKARGVPPFESHTGIFVLATHSVAAPQDVDTIVCALALTVSRRYTQYVHV